MGRTLESLGVCLLQTLGLTSVESPVVEAGGWREDKVFAAEGDEFHAFGFESGTDEIPSWIPSGLAALPKRGPLSLADIFFAWVAMRSSGDGRGFSCPVWGGNPLC